MIQQATVLGPSKAPLHVPTEHGLFGKVPMAMDSAAKSVLPVPTTTEIPRPVPAFLRCLLDTLLPNSYAEKPDIQSPCQDANSQCQVSQGTGSPTTSSKSPPPGTTTTATTKHSSATTTTTSVSSPTGSSSKKLVFAHYLVGNRKLQPKLPPG